jgi:hypothetical protein
MPDTFDPITTDSGTDWPEPDLGLLEEIRPALPDFPLHCLPPWWRAWVSETADAAGAPVDYVVQALLASVAGVCSAGVVARLAEGWDEPLILWQALVGGPSNGKTPALDALRRALAAVDRTAAADRRGPVIIDKATPLTALLASADKRPAGALLWRDESSHWLAALGCNGRRELVEVSALLASWAPLRTAQGPGAPAVSIIGCLDPSRLEQAMRGSDDGRAARFLYAWPRPAPYRSFLDRPALRESEAVNALQRIARAAGDPAAPLALSLDPQALKAFDRHLARLHGELQGCDGVEAAWLGKGRGTVARLAAVLALLQWSVVASTVAPPPSAIIGETLIAACTLWDYYRSHARAVLGRAFPSDDARLARRVLAWIRDQRAAQLSREDIRRDALGQALDAEQTLKVIRLLEGAGFLRKVAVAPGTNGRPPLRWDVHPALIGRSAAESAQTPPGARRSSGAVFACSDTT